MVYIRHEKNGTLPAFFPKGLNHFPIAGLHLSLLLALTPPAPAPRPSRPPSRPPSKPFVDVVVPFPDEIDQEERRFDRIDNAVFSTVHAAIGVALELCRILWVGVGEESKDFADHLT